jgi:hypothetical protein
MDYKVILASVLSITLLPATAGAGEKRYFTDVFPLDDCTFITDNGTNPYFIVAVGHQYTLDNSTCYAEGDCDEFETATITVTDETYTVTVDGREIDTRIISEEEYVDGELLEISYNYYAECDGSADVYYFGETVDIFEDCEVKNPDNPLPEGCVTHDGAWEAGIDGAQPGIIMTGGAFMVGARYAQEIAPGVAMDRSEHIAVGLDVEVPAGLFTDCVEVMDSTSFESNKHAGDTKLYCPGTGIVVDEDIELAP